MQEAANSNRAPARVAGRLTPFRRCDDGNDGLEGEGGDSRGMLGAMDCAPGR